MRFMQIESVLQTKNRSEPARNRFSVALLGVGFFFCAIAFSPAPVWTTGLSIELSDMEKFSSIQGEVLTILSDFHICSIYLNISLISKQGEVNQIRKAFSPKLPSRLSPWKNAHNKAL